MKLVQIQSAIGGHLVLVRIVDQSWSCERATFGPKIRQGSPAGPPILVRIAHQAYGRIIRGPNRPRGALSAGSDQGNVAEDSSAALMSRHLRVLFARNMVRHPDALIATKAIFGLV